MFRWLAQIVEDQIIENRVLVLRVVVDDERFGLIDDDDGSRAILKNRVVYNDDNEFILLKILIFDSRDLDVGRWLV